MYSQSTSGYTQPRKVSDRTLWRRIVDIVNTQSWGTPLKKTKVRKAGTHLSVDLYVSANISPKSHILSSPNSPILLRMLAVARSFCGDVAIGYVLSVLRITSSISEKKRVTKDVVFF